MFPVSYPGSCRSCACISCLHGNHQQAPSTNALVNHVLLHAGNRWHRHGIWNVGRSGHSHYRHEDLSEFAQRSSVWYVLRYSQLFHCVCLVIDNQSHKATQQFNLCPYFYAIRQNNVRSASSAFVLARKCKCDWARTCIMNMRNATCVETRNSKVLTRVTFLLVATPWNGLETRPKALTTSIHGTA